MEGIRDPINWIGITVFFGAVVAYAYLSHEAKQAAKKAAKDKLAAQRSAEEEKRRKNVEVLAKAKQAGL